VAGARSRAAGTHVHVSSRYCHHGPKTAEPVASSTRYPATPSRMLSDDAVLTTLFNRSPARANNCRNSSFVRSLLPMITIMLISINLPQSKRFPAAIT